MKRVRAGLFGVAAAAILALGLERGAPAPTYRLTRLVPQRPACDATFSPDGKRFLFVHDDTLWMGGRGLKARRIGGTAVNGVYTARWLSDDLILVHFVLPAEASALGLLDLKAGRFHPFARYVREGDVQVSRQGGMAVWRSTPRPGARGTLWCGVLSHGQFQPRCLGPDGGPICPVPSPNAPRLAGISAEGRPYLQDVSNGETLALQGEREERAFALAWSPDGSKLACLVAEGESAGLERASASPPGLESGRYSLVFYRVGAAAPVTRCVLPEAFASMQWDVDGRGLVCQAAGPSGALWHVPVSGLGGPRLLDPSPAISFTTLGGGYVLACLREHAAGEGGYLYLLSTRDRFTRQVGKVPVYDRITDVSADAHLALLARGTHDDRAELTQESALWVFELSDASASRR